VGLVLVVLTILVGIIFEVREIIKIKENKGNLYLKDSGKSLNNNLVILENVLENVKEALDAYRQISPGNIEEMNDQLLKQQIEEKFNFTKMQIQQNLVEQLNKLKIELTDHLEQGFKVKYCIEGLSSSDIKEYIDIGKSVHENYEQISDIYQLLVQENDITIPTKSPLQLIFSLPKAIDEINNNIKEKGNEIDGLTNQVNEMKKNIYMYEANYKEWEIEGLSPSTIKDYIDTGKSAYKIYEQISKKYQLLVQGNDISTPTKNPLQLITSLPMALDDIYTNISNNNNKIKELTNRNIEMQESIKKYEAKSKELEPELKISRITYEFYEKNKMIYNVLEDVEGKKPKDIEEWIYTFPEYINRNIEIVKKYNESKKQIENGEFAQKVCNELFETHEKIYDLFYINLSKDTKSCLDSISGLVKGIIKLYGSNPNPPKLDEYKNIEWLDSYFDQGQRTLIEKYDITSAAILSFLINHSISNLYIAIYDQDKETKLGMLNNLFVISEKFRNMIGFSKAIPALKEKFDIDSSFSDLTTSNEDIHKDDQLFQKMIKHLNDQGIKISPFYFTSGVFGKLRRVN
jgi:hypothetical protein